MLEIRGHGMTLFPVGQPCLQAQRLLELISNRDDVKETYSGISFAFAYIEKCRLPSLDMDLRV